MNGKYLDRNDACSDKKYFSDENHIADTSVGLTWDQDEDTQQTWQETRNIPMNNISIKNILRQIFLNIISMKIISE